MKKLAATNLNFAILLLALACSRQAFSAETAAVSAALNTIVSDDLQRHADVLADDTFEGREAGSRGGRAAAGYLVSQLEKLGVPGAGVDGTYYQTFGNGKRNVLAQLPGSDPELKSEIVLIGAHYDHVGYGNPTNSYGPTGYIHNGADDNASGTAGLLEVIEAFANLPEAPRRTIVFAFWDGEEQGLLGSKHFVSQPTVPLSSIKLLINMDMIGRMVDNKLIVYGSRSGFGFRQLVSNCNVEQNLIDFDWEIKANSDHHPFYSRNIPYLMPHTGLHDDYHRPRDDSDKLNAAGMQQTARLVFRIVHEVASTDRPAAFRSAARNEPMTSRALETPAPASPPRLGVTWNDELAEGQGLRITSVVAGTPAEAAALQVGDRIMTFAGRPLESDAAFRRDILAAADSFQIGVQREGMEELLSVEITPAGNPVRLGLRWREDAAEPGTLIVVLSVVGSPAEQAGIQVGDRIYSINGQPFAGSDDFRERVLSLPSPIDLQLERDGRIRTAVLELAAPIAAE